MSKTKLQCDLHDYIEIACMYQYQVKITTKSGLKMVGTPITTGIDSTRSEFLLLVQQDSKIEQRILMDNLSKMRILTPNAKFENIEF